VTKDVAAEADELERLAIAEAIKVQAPGDLRAEVARLTGLCGTYADTQAARSASVAADLERVSRELGDSVLSGPIAALASDALPPAPVPMVLHCPETVPEPLCWICRLPRAACERERLRDGERHDYVDEPPAAALCTHDNCKRPKSAHHKRHSDGAGQSTRTGLFCVLGGTQRFGEAP